MRPTQALRAFLFGSISLAVSPLIHAANIWDGGGADNNSTTANNWDNNVVPTGGTLTFAGTVDPTVVWNGINSAAPINLAGFSFSTNAAAFQINSGTQTVVQFVSGGTPLLNSSSNLQTLGIQSHVFFNNTKIFNADTAGLALNGGIIFRGDSLLSGNVNRLDLIGSADSTTTSISRVGTFTGTSTTSLVKNGTGKWTITGDVTDTGTTTITQGTLEFQGSVSSSSIANSGALLFNNAGTQSYANNISGGGSVSKQGAGTLTLSNTKTYTGATTITGGTLSVANIANGGSASGIGQSSAAASNLVFDGGTLQYTGATSTSNRAFTINSGKTANIEVTNGASNLSLIGATGAATNGALTKTGAGTLTLSGANSYTGATTVSQGTLKMGFSGSTAVTLTNASFETDAGLANNWQGLDITGWTNGTGIEQGTSNTFSGISGVIGLPNYNATTNFKWAFIQGAQTMSQTVTVATDGFYNVGFAASGRNGDFGPLNIQVLVDGVNQTSGTTITPAKGAWNTYTSNGVFLAAGSHTLAFSFINALGGDRSSTLDQVSLTGATPGSLAAATPLSIASGATFDINGTSQTVASLSDSGGGGGSVINSNSVLSSVLTVGSTSGSTTFSGAIGGGGGTLGLTKTGNSLQTLSSGGNSYTGVTYVNGGTLNITGTKSSSVGEVSVGGSAASGTPELAGSGTVNGAVTLKSASGGAVGILNAGDATAVNKVGTLAMGNTLSFESGSIFEWDLGASKDANGLDGNDGVAGTDFDSVSVTGTIAVASGSIFKVVFGSTVLSELQAMNNAFWNTPYGTQTWNMSSIFGEAFSSGAFTGVQTSTDVSAHGSFAINGTSLTWTAVPEPTSALAGLLIGAGLLRRRRTA